MARHGGKRQGSGRKLGGHNSTPPQAADQTPRPMFSGEAVQMLVQMMQEGIGRARRRPRTELWNPYIIRPERFGPVATHVKKRGMAMDDNTALMQQNQIAVQAWQLGGAHNDAAEGMMFLGYSFLSELAQRAEFRLFGEITSDEMTRKWIEIQGTDDESTKEEEDQEEDETEAEQEEPGNQEARAEASEKEKPRSDSRNKEIERKIKELNDLADELKLRDVFKSIASQNEYFGIAHLYLDLKGADINNQRDPENAKSIGNGRDDLSKAKLGRNCITGLRTIEPVWCYPISYNASNPLDPTWYDPQVWYVMGTEIHKTRLMPFIARPVPDILKPAYAFGGLAMTQLAQPYVDGWLQTRASVQSMIHAFSIMILKTNMGTLTQPGGAGGSAGDVISRMMLANQLRDNQGMMIIDKNTEEIMNVSAPLGSLDHLQAQAQEHMFSVGRIPAVKWTGIQPTGLNATSEGEMRAFNDTIHGRQEYLFRAGLTTILDIMQIHLWGQRDEDITFDFMPLHEMTDKEKGEQQKLEAETDQIRIDSGVVSQEEVRTKLVADPESGYHGLDPTDTPDLMEEEMAGLVPPGAGRGIQAEMEAAGELEQPGGGGGGPPRRGNGRPPQGNGREPGGDSAVIPFDGAQDADFVESEHPRDPGGKFTSGGGGGGAGAKPKASHTGGPNASPQKPFAKLATASLKKIADKKGTNPGGIYQAPDGQKYYAKHPKSAAHVQNENVAARLYQLAGSNTLEYMDAGPNVVATKYEKLTATNVHQLTPDEKKQAQKDFVTHAWLANWDAAGMGGDNIGVVNGKVTVLDVGGSLAYRAQGESKGAEFGTKVNELVTLLDPGTNEDTAALFKGMTLKEKVESAKQVTEIPDDAIREVVKAGGGGDALADKLIARKQDIAKTMGLQAAGPTNPEWEAKHPRGPGGKFAAKGGGEAPPVKEVGEKEADALKKALQGNKLLGKGYNWNMDYEDQDNAIEVSVLDLGEWVNPPGKEDEEDYDWQEPTAKTVEAVQKTVEQFNKEHPDLHVEVSEFGEKNYTYFKITAKEAEAAEPEGEAPGAEQDSYEDWVQKLFETKGPQTAKVYAEGFPEMMAELKNSNPELADKIGLLPAATGQAKTPPEISKPPETGTGKPEFKTFAWGQYAVGGTPKANHDATLEKFMAKQQMTGTAAELYVLPKLINDSTKFNTVLNVPALQQKLAAALAAAFEKQKDKPAAQAKIKKAMVKLQMTNPTAFAAGVQGIPPPKPAEPPKPVKVEKPQPAASPTVFKKAAEPGAFPKPTSAELEKAKKSVALQMGYVPGTKPEITTGQPYKAAEALLNSFNEKYSGKTLTDPDELAGKVNDFKVLGQEINKLAAAEAGDKAKLEAEHKAKAAEEKKKEATAAKAKAEAEKEKFKEQNKQITAELGITSAEDLQAFDAFVDHFGGVQNALSKFKAWQNEAESAAKKNPGHGFEKLSGFEMGCIKAYTGPQSGWINDAIINDSATPAQHMFEKVLNSALDKLPKKTGLVRRGLNLDATTKAKMKAGMVWTHRNFASSSAEGWDKNTKLHITATGKGGAYVAPISSHKGEGETLFKSNLKLLIDRVETIGGKLHVHCTEM